MTNTEHARHSEKTDIDAALADLQRGEHVWAATALPVRRALLDEVHDLTARYAGEWVQAALAIKDLDPDSPLVGEEWISGRIRC